MDSNDLEKERGITILSKNTSVMYNGIKINIWNQSSFKLANILWTKTLQAEYPIPPARRAKASEKQLV